MSLLEMLFMILCLHVCFSQLMTSFVLFVLCGSSVTHYYR